jgi:hypothetical protein
MVTAGLDALVGSEPAPEAIETALATVPGAALPEALRALAREHGIAALPVLRYCLDGRGEWAIAAAAALGTLPNPEAAAALRAAEARGGSKAVRTAARRALYRLRQAGVAAPAPPARAATTRALRPAAAWMSAVDGTGSRGLWLALEGPFGERTLLAAVVSDEAGLLDFSGGPIAKRRLDERLRALRAESALPWVPVPPAWAWHVLAVAAARAREAGRPVPGDLTGWLERLGPPPAGPPPIQGRVPEAALADPALLERSGELLGRPELAGWFLDPAGLTSEGLEWLQARESRLVVSEHAKAERLQALVERVAESRLDPEARGRWARRLEEQAWVLLELGQAAWASMAAAVAAALADPDRPPAALPFVRALVERSLGLAGEVASGRVPAEQVRRLPRPPASSPAAAGGA